MAGDEGGGRAADEHGEILGVLFCPWVASADAAGMGDQHTRPHARHAHQQANPAARESAKPTANEGRMPSEPAPVIKKAARWLLMCCAVTRRQRTAGRMQCFYVASIT